MAYVKFHDNLGTGGRLLSGNFVVSAAASSDLIPYGEPGFEMYDYDTLMVAQLYNSGDIGIVLFVEYYGYETIYMIESAFIANQSLEPMIELYQINVLFDIYDDLSGDVQFTNMLAGSDTIIGNRFADYLSAGAGNDRVTGNAGNDSLWGGTGNDSLSGGDGADKLYGESGKDSLRGGSGKDAFVFSRITESGTGTTTADVIADFARGQDRIDLRAIDAFARTAANEAFVWKGTGAFTSATKGEVSYRKVNNAGTSNDYTMVFLDNDGDKGAEMAIRLTGLHDLRASDFIL